MNKNIQTIKIDEDGKYLIIVEDTDNIKDLQRLSQVLREWWNSNEKFLVLSPFGEAKIRLERMEKDG